MENEPNVLTGGNADGKSVEDIAKIKGVPVEQIEGQLAKGVAVETEHTNDPAKAREIALDHLAEIPDYYDRLAKMEADAKNAPPKVEEPPKEEPKPVIPAIDIDEVIAKATEAAITKALGEFQKLYQAQEQKHAAEKSAAIAEMTQLQAENKELKRTAPTGVPTPNVQIDNEDNAELQRAGRIASSYRKGYR